MKMLSVVRFALAAVAVFFLSSVTKTTALPVGDVSSVPSNDVLSTTTPPEPDVVDVAGEATDVVQRQKRATTTTCLPPKNVTALFQSLNQHINASVLLQPVSLNHPVVLVPGELNIQDSGASMAYGDTSCPNDVETSPGSPIYARSTCPWYLRVEELPLDTYFPSVLPQAECRCLKCLRSTSTVLGCERIFTTIRVLRYTGCQDGFKTYLTETKTVSVGCTCAAPGQAVAPTTSRHPVDDYAE